MRVLHVGKFYPPEYRGGLESVVVQLNDELVRRGVAVSCVVAAADGRPRSDVYRGARVVRAHSWGTLLSQPLAPSLGRLVRDAPGDVVHLHHPNPLGDVAVWGDGRPLVVTQHSDVVRQRALWPIYGSVVRRALRRAAAIAIGSQQLLGTSRELRGFEHKVRIIPFGIDPRRFALTPEVAARAESLRGSWGRRPVILGVGRLVSYKGFDVLLRAARDLEATVVIVGQGPEAPRLRALAADNVMLAGSVGDQDLVAYYHACDVFCLPSVTIAEAFGIVLLEAMACAKPLVTTNLPTGVSAVNREGRTGLVVPPGDAGALGEALGALLSEPARREAMGRAAREVLEAEYTAALMGERYLKLYREVLGGGVSSAAGPAAR
jgi:rhamnosyl/mannosyltransferase